MGQIGELGGLDSAHRPLVDNHFCKLPTGLSLSVTVVVCQD